MIVERVRAGVARAEASGKAFGRPRTAPEVEQRIRGAPSSLAIAVETTTTRWMRWPSVGGEADWAARSALCVGTRFHRGRFRTFATATGANNGP
jgi:hypothetical protein